MPRYKYNSLMVLKYEPVSFDVSDLRGAVEYLKTVENRTKFVGILAEVKVKAGPFKLLAPAFLTLEEIEGKTPSEVWDMLDRKVEEQVRYFKQRSQE
jgi:hypothetical protein